MSFISIIVSIFTVLATLISPRFTAPVPEASEDDFVPVMRFVATSDTHIKTLGDKGCQRISKLLKTAYALSDADKDYSKLDAVVFSGDITDDGWFDSFAAFTATTNAELREGTERLAIVAKSHDGYMFGNNSLKVYSAMTGQETDFHRVINGFHFIGISRSSTLKHYTQQQAEWLDKELESAVKASPEKPVFVFQHEHVLDTVYGSSETDGWGLDNFTDVLKKYPQVIHISGHSHFPANDPRAIWQDSFTAINDGGLAYYELAVDGKNNQFPEGNDRQTQALLIEIDAENNVLVKVLDVDAGEFTREFLIDNVTEAKKTKYNHTARKEKSSAPFFDENAELTVESSSGKYTVTVPQATVQGDNEVFIYRISVTDKNGKEIYSAWQFSDYYFADMPESITFESFITFKAAKITVVAEDVWGNQSAPLTAVIE